MPEQNNSAEGQQIQIKVEDSVLKGVYANGAQVVHTPEEFILDFMNVFPPAGMMVARVIVSPAHMKRIVAALQENLQRFEAQFGAIKAAPGESLPTATSSSDRSYGFDTNKAA